MKREVAGRTKKQEGGEKKHLLCAFKVVGRSIKTKNPVRLASTEGRARNMRKGENLKNRRKKHVRPREEQGRKRYKSKLEKEGEHTTE